MQNTAPNIMWAVLERWCITHDMFNPLQPSKPKLRNNAAQIILRAFGLCYQKLFVTEEATNCVRLPLAKLRQIHNLMPLLLEPIVSNK